MGSRTLYSLIVTLTVVLSGCALMKKKPSSAVTTQNKGVNEQPQPAYIAALPNCPYMDPLPIPHNPYPFSTRSRAGSLVQDFQSLEIAPLALNRPAPIVDSLPSSKPQEKKVDFEPKVKEQKKPKKVLRELCGSSKGASEEMAIKNAKQSLVRTVKKMMKQRDAPVVFVSEIYPKEVNKVDGDYRAEVCGMMDENRLK